jgi:hypothetical protein
VLEDANSIQMSLMQIMRLLLTGQIEHKTASLLLYALQTASTNLRQTNFKPWVHEVILDPRDAAESVLDQTHLRDDEDFEEEEEEEEADEVEQEIRKKVEEAAEKARFVARWEAKKDIEARERGRKRYEGEEMLKDWVQQNPGYRLVRRERPSRHRKTTGRRKKSHRRRHRHRRTTGREKARQQHRPGPRTNQWHDSPEPELSKAYNEALRKEADKQVPKKPPQKETISIEAEKRAT